jgi:ubiquinone/menaquinone biosynthesis C-methylase UbiE
VIDPDFGLTAQDYRQFRAGFPIELLAPLASHGVGHPDQDVLDIGTGSPARLLALDVRSVQGVDPSPQLLEQAAAIDAGAGVSVTYRVGTAERTGLPSESVDVVTAGQCWYWFDADAAAAELARVLRPSNAGTPPSEARNVTGFVPRSFQDHVPPGQQRSYGSLSLSGSHPGRRYGCLSHLCAVSPVARP